MEESREHHRKPKEMAQKKPPTNCPDGKRTEISGHDPHNNVFSRQQNVKYDTKKKKQQENEKFKDGCNYLLSGRTVRIIVRRFSVLQLHPGNF